MSSVRPSNSGCTWIVGNLDHLLRYLRALPTIRLFPELDGRKLDIAHCLILREIFETVVGKCGNGNHVVTLQSFCPLVTRTCDGLLLIMPLL